VTRRLHALFGLCLAGIVALVTWNHAVWVLADGAPRLREDTLRHLERMLSQWQHLRHAPSAEAFWWADYYTPGGAWQAAASLQFLEPGIEAIRLGQAVNSGLLALGCGLLCLRAFGRSAGLAGAALAGTFPVWWTQLNHVMLEIPAAAMLALAIALHPSPGRAAWARTVLGALAYGLALLTHKKTGFALAGLSAWIGLRALVLLAWKRDRRHLAHLGEVLLYGCGALLVLPWLYVSAELIDQTVGKVRTENPGEVPTHLLVGLAAWFKHAFLTPAHAWLLLLGAALLPLAVRGRAVILPACCALAGMLFMLRFPQIHERYPLPMVPGLVLLMVVPTGLLAAVGKRPVQVVAHLVNVGLIAAGLAFQLLWQWPAHTPERTVGEHYASFDVCHPDRTIDENMPWLIANPDRWAFAVAAPRESVATYAGVAAGLVDHLPAPADAAELLRPLPEPGGFGVRVTPQDPLVWFVRPHADLAFLQAELIARDRTAVDVQELDPAAWAGRDPCAGRSTCFVLTPTRAGSVPDESTWLDSVGLAPLARLSPYRRDRRTRTEVVLWGPADAP